MAARLRRVQLLLQLGRAEYVGSELPHLGELALNRASSPQRIRSVSRLARTIVSATGVSFARSPCSISVMTARILLHLVKDRRRENIGADGDAELLRSAEPPRLVEGLVRVAPAANAAWSNTARWPAWPGCGYGGRDRRRRRAPAAIPAVLSVRCRSRPTRGVPTAAERRTRPPRQMRSSSPIRSARADRLFERAVRLADPAGGTAHLAELDQHVTADGIGIWPGPGRGEGLLQEPGAPARPLGQRRGRPPRGHNGRP